MNLVFKVGDSVIVKKGVKEPDYEEFGIEGWQGRVIDTDTNSNKNNTLVTIEWDSITLNKIPSDYIMKSEEEGYDWKQMILLDSDIDKAVNQDTESNVKEAQNKLSDDYYWTSFGEAGLRIMEILKGVDSKNEMKCLENWVKYLDEELTFPIHVTVTESEDNREIQDGDHVIVKSLTHIVDMYGIIASIELKGIKYEFPLCDLEVIEVKSKDYRLINDYRIWFGNR